MLYDDGEEEELNMAEEKFKFCWSLPQLVEQHISTDTASSADDSKLRDAEMPDAPQPTAFLKDPSSDAQAMQDSDAFILDQSTGNSAEQLKAVVVDADSLPQAPVARSRHAAVLGSRTTAGAADSSYPAFSKGEISSKSAAQATGRGQQTSDRAPAEVKAAAAEATRSSRACKPLPGKSRHAAVLGSETTAGAADNSYPALSKGESSSKSAAHATDTGQGAGDKLPVEGKAAAVAASLVTHSSQACKTAADAYDYPESQAAGAIDHYPKEANQRQTSGRKRQPRAQAAAAVKGQKQSLRKASPVAPISDAAKGHRQSLRKASPVAPVSDAAKGHWQPLRKASRLAKASNQPKASKSTSPPAEDNDAAAVGVPHSDSEQHRPAEQNGNDQQQQQPPQQQRQPQQQQQLQRPPSAQHTSQQADQVPKQLEAHKADAAQLAQHPAEGVQAAELQENAASGLHAAPQPSVSNASTAQEHVRKLVALLYRTCCLDCKLLNCTQQ